MKYSTVLLELALLLKAKKKITHKIRRTGSSWLKHALLGDDAVYLVSTGWQWLVFRPHKVILELIGTEDTHQTVIATKVLAVLNIRTRLEEASTERNENVPVRPGKFNTCLSKMSNI